MSLLTQKTSAGELVVDGGLGILDSKGYSLSQDKFAKIGYQETLWYALKERINTGLWLDTRSDKYSSSGFAGYQIGFDVRNSILEASIFSGPTLISNTDQDLGGHLQFNESIFLGIVDDKHESFGIAYNHFSSAGLASPNIGRDFFCLEIKFGL